MPVPLFAAAAAFSKSVEYLVPIYILSYIVSFIFIILFMIAAFELGKCQNIKTKVGPPWTVYVYGPFAILGLLFGTFVQQRYKAASQISQYTNILP